MKKGGKIKGMLSKAIELQIGELDAVESGSEAERRIVENIQTLEIVSENYTKHGIDKETILEILKIVLPILGSVATVMLICEFEKGDSHTSKALAFIPKIGNKK